MQSLAEKPDTWRVFDANFGEYRCDGRNVLRTWFESLLVMSDGSFWALCFSSGVRRPVAPPPWRRR